MKLRGLFVDTAPFHQRGFRWLFTGLVGGSFGRQTLIVAVPLEIFLRTNSTLLVGLAGLVQVVPLVLFSLVGGVISDAMDRARILVAAEIGLSLTAVLLAVNASSSMLWPIYVLVAVNAALNGIENTARISMIPGVVPPEELTSSFALVQSLSQTMNIVGPATAGVLIAQTNVQVAYIVAACASAFAAVAISPIRAKGVATSTGQISARAIADAWRFLRDVPLLMQLMVIDLNAMVFGLPRAVFPVLGTEILGGTAATVGLLYAAPGIGALVAALTAGWVGKVDRQGRAVVICVVAWGLSIATIGLAHSLTAVLVLLAVAGAADVISNIFRNTILQANVPDHLRGRVTSFKGALSGSASPLGDAEAGVVATLTTPTISIVSGGLASAIGAILIALWNRALWHQRAGDPPPVAPDDPRGGESTSPRPSPADVE